MQNKSQNVSMSFSASAAVAPIVLWRSKSPEEEKATHIYLQTKNTFLDFYTDENKQIRRSACSRSFSHDSILRTRPDSVASTAVHSSDEGSSTPSSHNGSKSPLPKFPEFNESGGGSSGENFDDGVAPSNGAATPTWEVDYSESPMNYYNPRDTWMPEDDLQVIPAADDLDWPVDDDWVAPVGFAQDNFQQPSLKRHVSDPTSTSWTYGVTKLHSKKKQDLKKLCPPPADYSGITTLMIRGIPCSFTQEDLLSIVDSAGLKGKYNFFYMPRGGTTGSNLGYVFINFTETIHAWTCAFTFNGIKLNPSRSAKTCTVNPADIQGIPALRKHFRRTVVNRGPNGPIFFRQQRSSEFKDDQRCPKRPVFLQRQHTA